MVDVLLLHPGEMGASIGAAIAGAGHAVTWLPDNRSPATQRRAEHAGLRPAAGLEEALREVDVVVSVVPPSEALPVAEQVASLGFSGVYLDANAVSPGTAEVIGGRLSAAGASVVDGGIVGPPAWQASTTRIALSGPRRAEAAALFAGSPAEVVDLGSEVGSASAFKVGFAAWTKGTSALVLAIDAFAEQHGVGAALREEWARRSMPIAAQVEGARTGAVPKAWRFDGEMQEIAASLSDAGLPAGFHDAAADIYRRLAEFKDQFDPAPDLAAVRDALRSPRPAES